MASNLIMISWLNLKVINLIISNLEKMYIGLNVAMGVVVHTKHKWQVIDRRFFCIQTIEMFEGICICVHESTLLVLIKMH
jgi:hypothetical protein